MSWYNKLLGAKEKSTDQIWEDNKAYQDSINAAINTHKDSIEKTFGETLQPLNTFYNEKIDGEVENPATESGPFAIITKVESFMGFPTVKLDYSNISSALAKVFYKIWAEIQSLKSDVENDVSDIANLQKDVAFLKNEIDNFKKEFTPKPVVVQDEPLVVKPILVAKAKKPFVKKD